tara:strand:- start:302 stop:439 length:138 start_codon:yes stop_codon:yes gene_type:complete
MTQSDDIIRVLRTEVEVLRQKVFSLEAQLEIELNKQKENHYEQNR